MSVHARAAAEMGEGRRLPRLRPVAISEVDAGAKSMVFAGEALWEREAAIEHENELF